MENTPNQVIIGDTLGTVIWTVIKAWLIGLVVAALAFSAPPLVTYGYADASLYDMYQLVVATLIFVVLCIVFGFVITTPLGLLAGFCAYGFAKQIAYNPLKSIAITTIIGTPLTVLYMSATIERRFGGLTETFLNDITRPSAIIYGIAIFSAASYLCLKFNSWARIK